MQRSDRVVVAWSTVLLVAVTLLWSLLLPPFRSADEAPYTSTAVRLATGGGYPEPGTVLLDPGVRASYPALGYAAPGSGVPIVPMEPRGSTPVPSWQQLREQGWQLDPVFDHDQVSQHPPLWAGTAAAAVRVLGLDAAPANVALLVLRWVSLAPLVLLPWLIMRCGLLVGLARPGLWLATAAPAAWPRFTEISAGVSNTPMTVVACSVVLLLALRASRGWVGARAGLLTGLALGVALLVKGLAFAFVPVVLLGAWLGARRDRSLPLLRHVLLLGAGSLVGLWWWLRNLVVLGVLQPTGFTPVQNATLNDAGRDLRSVLVDLPFGTSRDLWVQPMGDTVLTEVLHLTVTAVVLAAAVAAVTTRASGPPEQRWRLGLCLLPAPVVLLMTAAGALSGSPGVGVDVVAHARYVVVAAVGVALVVGCLGAVVARGYTALVLPVLGAVALAALAIEQTNLWAGPSVAGRAASMLTWWPVPAVVPIVLVGAVVLGVLALAVEVGRLPRLSVPRGRAPGSAPLPPRPAT